VAQLYNLQRPLIDAGAMETPGIYILDGKFRISSSLTGNRIEITADEVAGYDSAGTKQFYLRASDGRAVCAAGDIVLGDAGIDFDMTGAASQIRFLQGAWIRGYIYSIKAGTSTARMLLRSGPSGLAAETSELEIECMSQDLSSHLIRLYKSDTLGGIQIIHSGGNQLNVMDGYTEVSGTNKLRFTNDDRWIRSTGTNDLELYAKDWVICDISSGMDGIRPDADETGHLGAADYGWYAVYSKQFIDVGCLGDFSKGVELATGEIVSDTEALLRIETEENERALCGAPKLKYNTLPKVVARPVYNEDGSLKRHNAELTAPISVMIGAIRELTRDVRKLQEAQ